MRCRCRERSVTHPPCGCSWRTVFALKLLIVWELKDHPVLRPDAGLDTTAYVKLAQRVVAGDLALGPRLYFVSPLYIYFLSAALAGVRFVHGRAGAPGRSRHGLDRRDFCDHAGVVRGARGMDRERSRGRHRPVHVLRDAAPAGSARSFPDLRRSGCARFRAAGARARHTLDLAPPDPPAHSSASRRRTGPT